MEECRAGQEQQFQSGNKSSSQFKALQQRPNEMLSSYLISQTPWPLGVSHNFLEKECRSRQEHLSAVASWGNHLEVNSSPSSPCSETDWGAQEPSNQQESWPSSVFLLSNSKKAEVPLPRFLQLNMEPGCP